MTVNAIIARPALQLNPTTRMMQIVVGSRVLMQSRDFVQMHRLKNRIANAAARRPHQATSELRFNRLSGRVDVVIAGLTVGDAASYVEAEQARDGAFTAMQVECLSVTELASLWSDEVERRAVEDTHVLSDQAFEASVAAGRAYLRAVPAQMADWDAETADDALEAA